MPVWTRREGCLFFIRHKPFDTNLSLSVYLKMEGSTLNLAKFLVVSLISSVIILQQCKLSLAQQSCTVSCAQSAITRNMPYEEVFEFIQNREWENEDDFGGDLSDIIRRHKRVKRQASK